MRELTWRQAEQTTSDVVRFCRLAIGVAQDGISELVLLDEYLLFGDWVGRDAYDPHPRARGAGIERLGSKCVAEGASLFRTAISLGVTRVSAKNRVDVQCDGDDVYDDAPGHEEKRKGRLAP